MIIGSRKDMLENIVCDMKKHTSIALKELIKNNSSERRKEWMMWMMERKMAIIKTSSFCNNITSR
jgi:hypothetical protein